MLLLAIPVCHANLAMSRVFRWFWMLRRPKMSASASSVLQTFCKRKWFSPSLASGYLVDASATEKTGTNRPDWHAQGGAPWGQGGLQGAQGAPAPHRRIANSLSSLQWVPAFPKLLVSEQEESYASLELVTDGAEISATSRRQRIPCQFASQGTF